MVSFPVFLFLPVAPPNVKDSPFHSALPPPLFLSVPLFLYFVPPPLLPLSLWYADMQEFLGLKMIDQTCQLRLLLLKMAAPAVCALVIGALRSYTPCDWLYHVCPQSSCFLAKV